jgi:energy-converting hydrogenase Eha subunit G
VLKKIIRLTLAIAGYGALAKVTSKLGLARSRADDLEEQHD